MLSKNQCKYQEKKEKLNMKLAYWMYAGPAHIGTLRIGAVRLIVK